MIQMYMGGKLLSSTHEDPLYDVWMLDKAKALRESMLLCVFIICIAYSVLSGGQISGHDVLPILARENKENQPWKNLNKDEVMCLMKNLKDHKALRFSAKTRDRAVMCDVEASLNRLNNEVGDNDPLTSYILHCTYRLQTSQPILVPFLYVS